MDRIPDPEPGNATLARGVQGFVLRPGLWLLLWMALEGALFVLLAQKWGLGTVILVAIAKSALGLFALVWLTGRSLLKVSAPGFRLIQLERLGTGMMLSLAMMMPGFVLSFLALALLAPGLRAAFFRRATPPRREDVVDLEPGEWREIPSEAPRLPPEPTNRP